MALGFSPHLPVSVCGTGASSIHIPFLAPEHHPLSINLLTFRPTRPTAGLDYLLVSVYLTILAATESLPFVHRLRLAASP